VVRDIGEEPASGSTVVAVAVSHCNDDAWIEARDDPRFEPIVLDGLPVAYSEQFPVPGVDASGFAAASVVTISHAHKERRRWTVTMTIAVSNEKDSLPIDHDPRGVACAQREADQQ
jgi:hypothetical protein